MRYAENFMNYYERMRIKDADEIAADKAEQLIENQHLETMEIDDLWQEARAGDETAKRNLKLYYNIDFDQAEERMLKLCQKLNQKNKEQ